LNALETVYVQEATHRNAGNRNLCQEQIFSNTEDNRYQVF